ncbi:hypothetical protein M758_12G058300 [Ceratodon purpureus]|uniref:Uncharacterized protein n=1 Tax=Ceratodon purpureus TaxID=3225 RepID=A0A8T0G6C9_CERPU|nr:hypothetical protein KC19_12G055500 [Ceratodon purpureus]KAG0598256.1 hypothetical protein M758_12G058300 [Ceratodon purpureus]
MNRTTTMAFCREPMTLASCSGRIDDSFIPNSQSRDKNYTKFPTARFFTSKDFVSCRVVRSQARDDASTFRTGFREDFVTEDSARHREWQIEVLQSELGEQKADNERFQRFYATCEKGLEEILAAELSSPLIGALQVEAGSGGVSFVGTQSTGFNANLWLRTGDHVLCELARGPLSKGSDRLDRVYDFVREAVDWSLILVDDGAAQTRAPQSAYHNSSSAGSSWGIDENNEQPLERLSETAVCSSQRYRFRKFSVQTRISNVNGIKNQSSVSTSVSNAIWDALRDACGGRWPGSPERESEVGVPLFLYVNGDEGILYRDMSGVSLHKRGYEESIDRAKSKEALAAAILTIAGWNHMVPGFGDANKNVQMKDRVFLDPFCGTGTILIQAALMACNVAPGLMRRQWPFQTWHDYDQRAWTQCRDSATSMQVSSLSGARLIGNDMNDGAIVKCKRAARAAGVLHLLDLSCEPSRYYRPPFTPSLIVTNPPCSAPLTYSSLRGEDERLLTLWRGFGQFLKSQCRGADVYVLSENDWLTQAMHLVPDRKWDMQPDKHWRGRATGRTSKTDKIFGSQERKLLHYHLQLPPRPVGDPVSALPFSPLSPKSSRS